MASTGMRVWNDMICASDGEMGGMVQGVCSHVRRLKKAIDKGTAKESFVWHGPSIALMRAFVPRDGTSVSWSRVFVEVDMVDYVGVGRSN